VHTLTNQDMTAKALPPWLWKSIGKVMWPSRCVICLFSKDSIPLSPLLFKIFYGTSCHYFINKSCIQVLSTPFKHSDIAAPIRTFWLQNQIESVKYEPEGLSIEMSR